MQTVYIAGPLTKGSVEGNINKAVKCATAMKSAGHAPFIPHLMFFWGCIDPDHYEAWMIQCLEWVRRCDFFVRIPGPSSGADREEALAEQLKKPIFYYEDGKLTPK